MSSNNRLEIGGNVFEVIEFSLERTDTDGKKMIGKYGVNVAKVREVVRLPEINPLASRIPSVAGLFELRGIPIPAIKLSSFLGDDSTDLKPDMQIIVTEFSGKRAGFIVNSTSRIRRINWVDVLPVNTENSASLNGMTLIEKNEFLFIVDLERIIANIENVMKGRDPNASYESMWSPDELKSRQSETPPISVDNKVTVKNEPASHGKAKLLVVDDSKFILDGIANVLKKLGYRVITAGDGLEGKEVLEKMVRGSMDDDPIDLIVTDLEMPKMDGLSLVKWIKSHDVLSKIPVLIHSSLSSAHSQTDGLALGAQGYVIKNDVKQLDAYIKELLGSDYVPGTIFKNAS